MLQNKPYQNVEKGWYEIAGQRIYFKSKMERNYALYLDWLRRTTGDPVQWWYERDNFVFEKIQFGTRQFKVDFTLLKPSGAFEYHECKGFMDKKSATKLKRMKLYYPEKKVVLIDNEQYKSIMRWKRLFGGY